MKYTIHAITLACLFGLANCADANTCITSENESNDSESNANAGMCSNTTIAGNLSRNDIDWFTFDMAEAGTIQVELDHNSNDDFDWALYRESGSAVQTAETGSVPETGSYSGTAGTYYLKLTRYSGRGWYDLTVNYGESDGSGGSGGTGQDCGYGTRPSVPNGLSNWLTGSGDDICGTETAGNGSVLLMGGGTDVDAAFTNRVKPQIGSNVDTVILRTSGSDGYNDYLSGLLSSDSVETLLVDTTSLANSDYVEWVVKSAEFVFVAGGDQSDYLNQWQGTKLQSALQHVYDKGGVIGGTSAGMALMASSIYDPDGLLGAISDEVVTDLCHETINFSNGFVDIPVLSNSLTDTHFANRDRMGRTLVFQANHNSSYYSIAADENASIFVNSNGQGVVDGSGDVYVLRDQSQTSLTQGQCGQEVIYEDVLRVKLSNGDTYNFSSQSHTGSELSIGIDGTRNNYYLPSDPYQ
ncbi:MAG: cyanophycinase [Gammaproteobacteria bacterium]|nr:cyanophycinase [Gammaproteobacteria bacterium]